jgi:hypothetical protein
VHVKFSLHTRDDLSMEWSMETHPRFVFWVPTQNDRELVERRHSSRNCVGTREVDSTSSFDAVTYFTIVGM